jgi:N-acyl-phosphatidylethanolamine-hydrolysing phospholipase D
MNKLSNWSRLPTGIPKSLSKPSTTSIPPPPRPSHHANDEGTAFKNPWPSADAPKWSEFLSFSSKFPIAWYEDLTKKHPETRDVKVVVPDWGEACLRTRGLATEECVVGTVLGHAGVVVEIPLEGTRAGKCTGRTIGTREREDGKEKFYVLCDPIFSDRAGPTKYTGPQRMRPSPCQVGDLPGM